VSEKAIRDKNEDDPIGAFKQAREMDPEWNAKLDADLERYKSQVAPPGRKYGPTVASYAPPTGPSALSRLTPEARKSAPVYSGVLRYFPLALAAVAHCSKVGNDQHNPGQPLHWAREKSTDEGDALVRHLLEAGTRDVDGIRHATKVAWRALALLQKEIERDGGEL
jgi:hypothetical protein